MRTVPAFVVLVPQTLSPTTVGIGWSSNYGTEIDMTFWVLCPDCTGFLTYQNSRDPDLVCDNCGKRWTKFPGIPSGALRHAGPRYQVFQTSSSVLVSDSVTGRKLVEWIELWTGLTDIEVSITV